MTSSQWSLLATRRYLPLFITQSLGAFNDNLFKSGLLVAVVFGGLSVAGLDARFLSNAAAGVFILPFLLFSASAGQVAEIYDMARLARWIKGFEILIMALAAYGFIHHQAAILMLCLFLMGTHSSFFGPVKYAILPQYLKASELVGGNALIEMATFMAILLGQVTGTQLQGHFAAQPGMLAGACLGVAVLGALSSLAMPSLPALAPQLRFDARWWRASWRLLQHSARELELRHALLCISWFWFFGAVYLTQWVAYVRDDLGGQPALLTLLIALFSIGIGLGSLLCESLSGRRVELGLVPWGCLGLSLFGIDLYAARPLHPAHAIGALDFIRAGHDRLLIDVLGLGVSGAWMTVPLYAHLQKRSRPEFRARAIAANNLLNALFMVGASIFSAILLAHGVKVPQLLLLVALLNAGVLLAMLLAQPLYLQRLLLWVMLRWRAAGVLEGESLLPAHGGVLLLCAASVDPAHLIYLLPRPVRLLGHQRGAAPWWRRQVLHSAASRPPGGVEVCAGASEDPASRGWIDQAQAEGWSILQVQSGAQGLQLCPAQALP